MEYDICDAQDRLEKMRPSLERALDTTASLFEGRLLDSARLGKSLRTLAEQLKPVVDLATEISVNDSSDPSEFIREEDLIRASGRGLLAKVGIRAESLSDTAQNDFDSFPELNGQISLSLEDGEILERLRLFRAVYTDPAGYDAELEERGQSPGEFVTKLLEEEV